MDWLWLEELDGPSDGDLDELAAEAKAMYPDGFCPACGSALDDDMAFGIIECNNCGLREWMDE